MKSAIHRTRVAMVVFASIVLTMVPSCIKEKPEALPDSLEWNPEFAFPLGEERYGMNSDSGFDTTLLEIDSITGLPAWVGRTELVMEGILQVDLSVINENLDNLNRILLRVNSANEFPHTVYSQAYFRDEALNVIDSMFEAGPVATPPGRVSNDGATTEPAYARHDAIIEGDRIAALGDAQSILFRATFLTTDTDSALIPFYPTFSFEISSGMMLDLSFEY